MTRERSDEAIEARLSHRRREGSMRRFIPLFITLALALPTRGAAEVEASRPVSFRKDVAPILVKNCLGCHNARKAQGGLSLATFALLKKGGKAYGTETLTPGDPDASGLVELVRPDGE